MSRNKVAGIIVACAAVIMIGIVLLVFKPWQWPACPEVAWNKAFGGSWFDYGYSVQQTSDGGYIITGSTDSYGAGEDDVWLIKTDSSGNEMWNKTFGGSERDCGYSVQQTSDGGYIIAGFTNSYGVGSSDGWLIKTDSSGSLAWNKTFGGSEGDSARSVQQTPDGGYIVAGKTRSYGWGNVWLLKTDSLGNMAWSKALGGSGDEEAYSVDQTSDGGYVIVGWTHSFEPIALDAWLIKTDSLGNEVWSKTFGGSRIDRADSVQQTSDGGYIIAGSTTSYGAVVRTMWGYTSDVWLIKTDSSGNEVWSKTFGGSLDDEGYSVQQTADGGYVIAGHKDSYGAGDDGVWLIKTDASGNELWNKIFDGSSSRRGGLVQQTSDGGYIVMGRKIYSGHWVDTWLIKLTA